ncbi:hypothetical protein [Arthrobacter bambusae]|uniref:hypothetical protein n=1 Tax=Arthrobacter bambusae TaxID=1338426 RepID=UPI002785CE76|nr:hypothetical protein [Arthrobacter bambusae]MDQ0029081.1 hypothetical protein [Arthrobacter bambusae]MDQ0098517.1 hypothetical protein [Arthrobacter bambusae]
MSGRRSSGDSEWLAAHWEEPTQIIADEMGCTITQSRNIQVVNPVVAPNHEETEVTRLL